MLNLKKIVVAAVGAGAVVVSIGLLRSCADDGRSEAERIVLEKLAAPSTATFPRTTLLEKTRDPRTGSLFRLVHVVVHAQNQFGAVVRSSYCVVFHDSDSSYLWDDRWAASTCNDPPTTYEVGLTKNLNHWPKEF